MSRQDTLRGAATFMSPAAVVATAFSAVPLLYIVYTSFGGIAGASFEAYGRLVTSGLFLRSLSNTLVIAFWASLLSLTLGYVVALHLARQTPKMRAVLLVLVLVPFWTSVLVKCYAFTIILGRTGILNGLLSWASGSTVQLALVLNRVGVLVGMTNYLTPFVVFPVLASLLAIDGSLYRAAAIMGAGPLRTFLTVTLPLSVPGIVAAFSSVFVMALSFFIVPALLGGPRDAMLSNLVDFYTRETLDWNAASAIGVLLLGMILVVLVPANLFRKLRAGR